MYGLKKNNFFKWTSQSWWREAFSFLTCFFLSSLIVPVFYLHHISVHLNKGLLSSCIILKHLPRNYSPNSSPWGSQVAWIWLMTRMQYRVIKACSECSGARGSGSMNATKSWREIRGWRMRSNYIYKVPWGLTGGITSYGAKSRKPGENYLSAKHSWKLVRRVKGNSYRLCKGHGPSLLIRRGWVPGCQAV